MARDSRFFKRAGRWTFSVRVPADSQGKIGKKEIWKSLGDVPHAEARRLARVESVNADALFADARPQPNLRCGSPAPGADLSPQAGGGRRADAFGCVPARRPCLRSLRKIMLVGQSAEDASLQLVATALAAEARVGLGRDTTIIPRLKKPG
ncbi:DUF6538 domain-containing protein [Xanthobacter flavus]|uniref:DUF6538 domain-containing protein n=1 Tax=Xanthobacter flavus TaxID=281 RepID=UPI00372D41F3